jgi:hypothetical protein
VPDGSAEGVVALGGIGGMHQHGRVRVPERWTPDAQMLRMTIRWPGQAKNRQLVFRSGEFLFFFGGNNSLEQHDFAPENFVAEGWRVHLPTGRSERIVDFPAARQSMVLAQTESAVYAFGGFGFSEGAEAATTQPEIYAFDGSQWQMHGQLPAGLTQFAAVLQGDEAWLLGGLNYDPSRGEEAAFQHVTHPVHGSLDALAEDESIDFGPRRAFASTTVGSSVYVVGGMREGFQLVEGCFRFDLPSGEEHEIACLPPRLGGDLVALPGGLLLAGGSVRGEGAESISPSQALHFYDIDANTWSEAGTLPFSSRHARAMADRGRALVISTHSDEGRLELVWLSPPATN